MVDNAFIARTRAVNGCFSMFLLMFLITFIPLFIENRTALMRQGLLLPLLYGMEFVAIFSYTCSFSAVEKDWAKARLNATILRCCCSRCW